MGCYSLAHSEAAQADFMPSTYSRICHTLRAFPLFSSGHQVSVARRTPKPNFNALNPPGSETNGQIQGSFLKMFLFLLPAPSHSPRHCTISDLRCQDPVLLHLCKHRRKAPRHCQDVCIIQVRGRRENKREAGAQGNNAVNSWHESRTPAI